MVAILIFSDMDNTENIELLGANMPLLYVVGCENMMAAFIFTHRIKILFNLPILIFFYWKTETVVATIFSSMAKNQLIAVMCMSSVFCYQRCAYGQIILAG